MEVCRQVESCRPESFLAYECVIEMRICDKPLDGKPVASESYVSDIDRDGVVRRYLDKILIVEGQLGTEGSVVAESSWEYSYCLLAEW